jgi:putative DNA primase/helicase
MHWPRESYRDLARGRWRGVLAELGIGAKFLEGKNCPCPICGGKDRFRFADYNGDGVWICNHCGTHQPIELLKQFHGWDFKEAVQRIEAIVSNVPVTKPKAKRTEQDERDAMNAVWRESKPITPDDPVGRWLTLRCGVTTYPPCLRYLASARYQDDGAVSWHPAMLAKVVDAKGQPLSVHRTFLARDGAKADVPKPRKVMSGSLPRGLAIRLAQPSETLGIAEGIETALSATALFDMPCWSAMTAGFLETWAPPEGVKRVVIFADSDESYAGQKAAYVLASRLATTHEVDVRVPARMPADWNDVHQAMRQQQQEPAEAVA